MKITQKLEILFGIATLAAALLSFYFVHLPIMQRSNSGNSAITELLMGSFLVFLLPLFLTIVGVYIHVIKQNIVGFIIVIIFGSVLTFSHAIGLLIGPSFNGHLFLGISPGIFAAATVFLAVCPTLLSLSQSDATKLR